MFELKGERVKLRRLRRSDASSMARHAHDKAISRYTTLPYPYRLEGAYEFIKLSQAHFRKKEAYELGIVVDGNVVGTMSLFNIDRKNGKAEMGYWIGREFWGRGLVTEAARLIMRFGFEEVGLERIFALVMHPNRASSKVLERLGFSYEGRLRKDALQNGRRMDHLVYGMLAEEFK